MPLAALGVIGAIGSIGGAAIGASAASNAASTQADAAKTAAQLQFESQQQALQFEEQQWQQAQTNAAPWLQTGGSAELALGQLLGLPGPSSGMTPGSPFPASVPGAAPTAPNPNPAQPTGSQFSMMGLTAHPGVTPPGMSSGTPVSAGSFGMPASGVTPGASTGRPVTPGMTGTAAAPTGAANPLGGNLQPFAPWTTPFVAPTNVTEQNDPGYQFRMSQGLGALENSAAARGGLLSGNTAEAEQQFAQGLASNEYGNVYNRALGQYQQNYNIYQQNQANQWNRLASLAGLGQTTAGQLNSAGLQAGSSIGNILLGGSQAIGQNLNNAAAATASGYIGGANAYGGALGGIGGNVGNLLLMQQLLGNKGGPVDLSGVSMNPVPGSALGDYGAP
ncbi:MAG TPA: hypothetical protein VMQ17_08785 [Candidatus Sulfotelmatobacter sp.]|nr:hypothetical protein [Candidatus Sulfotelmatobacter sp.]